MSSLKCPDCGEAIEIDWIRCPNCHEFLKKKCPECDKNIDTKWEICPFCGAEITTNPGINEEKTRIYSDISPDEKQTKIYSGKICKTPKAFSEEKAKADEYLNIGLNFHYKDFHDSAIESFEKALKINPNYTKAKEYLAYSWYDRSYLLFKQKNYELAIESFEKFLQIDSSHKQAKEYLTYSYYRYATFLYNKKKYSEAIVCYEKAIAIDPNYAYLWKDKGIALDDLGRYSEAIKCYEKAIEINPNYAEAWWNIGVALENLGRDEEAQVYFQKSNQIQQNK